MAVAIALIVFATSLGLIAAGENVLAWDLSYARWIQRWQSELGKQLYRVGDTLGTTANAAAVTLVALVAAVVSRNVRLSLFLVLVLVLRLAGVLLKPAFDSPRPTSDVVQLLKPFEGTGYPSGHSMTAAMVATMLILLVWNYSRILWLQLAVTITMIGVAILVGWSRIWSGAHWPSDVLGGWCYGVAMVLLAWIASSAIASRYETAQLPTN